MDHINFVNRIDELLEKKGINRAKLLRETELSESTLRGMQEVYTNFKAEDLTDILKWQKDLFLELNS